MPRYENFIALGDFNAEKSGSHMSDFCTFCNLKNLIKEPACYKNAEQPTSVDHNLPNHPRCLQHCGVSQMGVSDFHKQTFIVLEMFYAKTKTKNN